MLAGMVLGALVAFLLERRFWYSAAAAGVGAVLSFIGLIHAPQVAWAAAPGVALGYAMLAIVLIGCAAWQGARPATDPAVADQAEQTAEAP